MYIDLICYWGAWLHHIHLTRWWKERKAAYADRWNQLGDQHGMGGEVLDLTPNQQPAASAWMSQAISTVGSSMAQAMASANAQLLQGMAELNQQSMQGMMQMVSMTMQHMGSQSSSSSSNPSTAQNPTHQELQEALDGHMAQWLQQRRPQDKEQELLAL